MPDQTHIAYLSIGTNVGNLITNIVKAIQHISTLCQITRISSVYKSKSWKGDPQPDYLNCSIKIKTNLPPHSLLSNLKNIEKQMGRKPAPKWAPRIIDIDLLLYDNLTIHTQTITIPHPGLYFRPFFTVPLLEIDPDLKDPVSGIPLNHMPANIPELLELHTSSHNLLTLIQRTQAPQAQYPATTREL